MVISKLSLFGVDYFFLSNPPFPLFSPLFFFLSHQKLILPGGKIRQNKRRKKGIFRITLFAGLCQFILVSLLLFLWGFLVHCSAKITRKNCYTVNSLLHSIANFSVICAKEENGCGRMTRKA